MWATEGGLATTSASIGTVNRVGASVPSWWQGWSSPASPLPGGSGSGIGLGIWLIAAAVGSVFAAPATVWGIDALAGCAGFLFAAVIESRPVRP